MSIRHQLKKARFSWEASKDDGQQAIATIWRTGEKRHTATGRTIEDALLNAVRVAQKK